MEPRSRILKQQLEIERKIVPDNKEVEQFIKWWMPGHQGRIEIRRSTARPVTNKSSIPKCPSRWR